LPIRQPPFFVHKNCGEGGNLIIGEKWTRNVQVDGKLVIGQIPASSKAIAKAVIKLLQ